MSDEEQKPAKEQKAADTQEQQSEAKTDAPDDTQKPDAPVDEKANTLVNGAPAEKSEDAEKAEVHAELKQLAGKISALKETHPWAYQVEALLVSALEHLTA